METNNQRSQRTNAQLHNYVTLLSNNINGAQHVNKTAIYKNTMPLYTTLVYKTRHNNNTNRKNMVKLRINYLVGHQSARWLRVVSTPVFIEEEASIEYLTPYSSPVSQTLTKYLYYSVPKSQLNWLTLSHSPILAPPMTAKARPDLVMVKLRDRKNFGKLCRCWQHRILI